MVGKLDCTGLARAWPPYGRAERDSVVVLLVREQKSGSGSSSRDRREQFPAFSAVLRIGVHAESLEIDFVEATLGGGVGGLMGIGMIAMADRRNFETRGWS